MSETHKPGEKTRPASPAPTLTHSVVVIDDIEANGIAEAPETSQSRDDSRDIFVPPPAIHPNHNGISFIPSAHGNPRIITTAGLKRLHRLAMLSGLFLAAVMVTCFAVLAKYNQLTSNAVDPAEIKFTPGQMYLVGLFNFIGSGFALLLLATTVIYRISLRGQLAATGRLPLPVIVIVGFGYALTFHFNGTLIWAFYANTIPSELVTTNWFYIIFLVFPNYLCRGLSSLPITATMLRTTTIYFGVVYPFPVFCCGRSVNRSWLYLFVFVMLLPCIVIALYDSIDVLLTSVLENNEQIVSYLLSLFVALVCDFLDLWQVFCMFLLRHHLRRFDLDNTKILVVLSCLYLANSVLGYLRVATPLTNYLFSHVGYTVLLYFQVLALYFYSYRTIHAMLRRGSTPTLYASRQNRAHFDPTHDEFAAAPAR